MTDMRDRLEDFLECRRDFLLVGSGVVAGALVTSVVSFAVWGVRPDAGPPDAVRAVAVEAVAEAPADKGPDVVRVRDVVGDAVPSTGTPRGASSGISDWCSVRPFGSYEVSLPEGLFVWGVSYDADARRLTYGTVESSDGTLEDRCVMRFYDEGAVGAYGMDRSQLRRSWRMRSGRAAAIVDGPDGMRVVVVDDGDTDMALSYAVPYDEVSDADGSWGEVVCDVCGCDSDLAADALDDVMAVVAERTWGV